MNNQSNKMMEASVKDSHGSRVSISALLHSEQPGCSGEHKRHDSFYSVFSTSSKTLAPSPASSNAHPATADISHVTQEPTADSGQVKQEPAADMKRTKQETAVDMNRARQEQAADINQAKQGQAPTSPKERTFITCMNCKTTVTPLWRRDPLTNAHLCNRCGLYLKTYNVMHPLTRIKRRAMSTTAKQQNASIEQMDDVEQVPRAANCNPPQLQLLPSNAQRKRRVTPKQQISAGITPRCFNCSAESTPLWRRDPEDNIICNACGLYYKLHAKPRPISMRRPAIKRRNRAAGIAALVLPATAKSVPRADAGSI
ncbi:GATA type transcriptional activator of nitrogen-regulated proteins, partial [Coemansia sp. RSA 2618]